VYKPAFRKEDSRAGTRLNQADSVPFGKRDKFRFDLFWLKEESLEDSANLPPPDIIDAEMVEDLQTAHFSRTLSELLNSLKLQMI